MEQALSRVAEVEAKIAAHDAATVPSTIDLASFATLAADLKSGWTAPTTDARLKKRIVRTVIHEVIADIDTNAAEIVLLIHWVGGVHTEIRLPTRRRGQRTSTSAGVIAAVRKLVLISPSARRSELGTRFDRLPKNSALTSAGAELRLANGVTRCSRSSMASLPRIDLRRYGHASLQVVRVGLPPKRTSHLRVNEARPHTETTPSGRPPPARGRISHAQVLNPPGRS